MRGIENADPNQSSPPPAYLGGGSATRQCVAVAYLTRAGAIILLGLFSSVITAVIAALILVEAIAVLKLDRQSEAAAVVLACFAIGLGAALTPVGEPLGTIAIAALNADFWYLMRLLGPLVMAGIVIVGAISLFLPAKYGHSLNADPHPDSWVEIVIRAVKVYMFVAGLAGLS